MGEAQKNAQQRRPPPAADTGRSCWGRGQQDTSAAQGTKWTLGTATRRIPRLESSGHFSGSLWCAKENFAPMQERFNPRHRRAIPPILPERKRANVPHGTLALSPHLCAAAVGMRTVYSMYPSRSSRCAVAGTPLSVIRRMAWSMVFTKMRTSFTIEMR